MPILTSRLTFVNAGLTGLAFRWSLLCQVFAAIGGLFFLWRLLGYCRPLNLE